MNLSVRMDVQSVSETQENPNPRPPFPGRVGDGTPGPGRPKGVVDRRVIAGRKAAQALAAEAWELVHQLLANEDKRLALDAAKIVLEYAHGKPRQSLDLDVRGEASRIAAEIGVPPDVIVAEAARLAAEADN